MIQRAAGVAATALLFAAACAGSDGGSADTSVGDDSGGDEPGVIGSITGGTSTGEDDTAPICTPGDLACSEDAGAIVICSQSGQSWNHSLPCASPQVCEHETVACKSPLCEPGERTCIDGSTVGECNLQGTSVLPVVPCPEDQGCDPGTLLCAPHVCEPDHVWCDPDGVPWRCWGNGLGKDALTSCEDTVGECAGCLSNIEEASCESIEAGGAPEVTTCQDLQACVPNFGCYAFDCKALTKHCDFTSEDIGCEALAGCIPLPAFTGDEPEVLGTSTTLSPSFVAGASSDGTTWINVAPIVNPQTGGYLEGLSAANLTLEEDGQPVALTCSDVKGSPHAFADVVFAIDATGSMGWVFDAVTAQAIDLATHLADEGLDVQFGAVTFRDTPNGVLSSYYMDLAPDAASLAAFLGGVSADGGGDAPENALDAVMTAWNNSSWRLGAQKVFVLITDAPMHDESDGFSYAQHGLTEVLSTLSRSAIVHTVSWDFEGETCIDNTFPNPRFLSCATGGTAAALTESAVGDLAGSSFAEALADSLVCTFPSANHHDPHTLTLTVQAVVNGTAMSGATTLYDIPYE